jgi:uncharacterized membrane protein
MPTQIVQQVQNAKREMQRRGWGGSGQNGHTDGTVRWARALGWFSLGIGLAEMAAPGSIAKLIGIRQDHRGVIRTMGLREIASGVGVLTQRRPSGALWSRVGGDAVDLALLGAAALSPRSNRGRVAAATAAVAGVTLLDYLCAQQLSGGRRDGALRATASVTISRSPEELYRFWHDFENLPRFMTHLESVRMSGNRSHWVARGPAGTTVEWDAELTEDVPNEVISWRSVEGSDVDHAGSIRFAPATGDRGTIVLVDMHYRPPGGVAGAAAAALFGEEPNQSMQRDLRRFKQVMETGEIITTEGQPAGRSSSLSWTFDQAVKR